MVYCTNCGEQNPDDAEFCKKCGAALRPGMSDRRARYERERGMCFGVPIGVQVWGILFGLIIVLWGAFELLGLSFNFWAVVAIIFGAIILIGALRRGSTGKTA